MTEAGKLDVKRRKPATPDVKAEVKAEPVSAGAVNQVVDYVFNPTREKIREVTYIDRSQGRLLPQLDIIDLMWQYVIEVATFRQDQANYSTVYGKVRPTPPNLISEFSYRTAQWQKSINGTNLKSAIDIALAEIETRSDSDGDGTGGDGISD